MSDGRIPAGYVRVASGKRTAVVLEAHLEDARAMLGDGTLHGAASRTSDARELMGRGVAYAIALPASGARAVVRHNRHGGLLARFTRDLFLSPTRAPYELEISEWLRERGVNTPRVIMYGLEPASGPFARSDVVTEEIAASRDLSTYMLPGDHVVDIAEAWETTGRLLRSLTKAGARHHDLNVKNVLIARANDGTLTAWVLDVDRVVRDIPDAPELAAANMTRLFRSARKWRDERGARFEETMVAQALSALRG